MKLSEFKTSKDTTTYIDDRIPNCRINWYIEMTKEGKIVKCTTETIEPKYLYTCGIKTNLNLYLSAFTEKKEEAIEFANKVRLELIKENKWKL